MKKIQKKLKNILIKLKIFVAIMKLGLNVKLEELEKKSKYGWFKGNIY